jgi:hypothetical protein
MYTQVKFGKGMGLGNRLWPWSRCKIFTRDHGAQMLAPDWFHFRTAPFRMGGIDYGKSLRKMLLYGNFVHNDEISGLKKAWILMRNPQVTEDRSEPSTSGSSIVVFSGYGRFFADLLGERDFLKQELLRITNDRDRKEFEAYPAYDIGINIRLGRDFPHRTPVRWYADVLQRLLEFRPGLRSVVITDGTAEEIQPLLSLPGVELLRKRSAILDMLILGKARLIIGAGGSSFTAWGSFLSGAPTIILKGLPMDYLGLYNNSFGLVKVEVDAPGELLPDDIPGWPMLQEKIHR